MNLEFQTWEQPLLSRAHEARGSSELSNLAVIGDQVSLERAHRRAAKVTAAHSRSIYLATALLPKDKRQAVRALYAFFRTPMDLVSRRTHGSDQTLAAWRKRALSPAPPAHDLLATAWADVRARYRIPRRYVEQLVEGVERVLHGARFQTFDDLASHAYAVASTVVLMCMHIVGFRDEGAVPYVIKLGVALQITEILRDVGGDWRDGRVFLPVEEMEFFGIEDGDLAVGRVDERWQTFMSFQIARNRSLYDEALQGIDRLNRDGRLAMAVVAELYRAVLEDIEAHGFDVFTRRARVGTLGKLARLPGVLWRRFPLDVGTASPERILGEPV